MAPRRSVKNVADLQKSNNYNNLTFNDVLCPICRSILIEPVTLPCNHGFCSTCFDGTIANTNLVCPLCRIRISSWLRKTSKSENKLVNIVLWNAIKKNFPNQVKNKIEGHEEYLLEDVSRKLTIPGEIRREYEIEKAKDEEELTKQREEEAKASLTLIKKLAEEEEKEKRVHEENLRLSEQIAKKLVEDIAFDHGASCSNKKVDTLEDGSCKRQPNSNLIKKQLPKKQLSIDKFMRNMSQKKVGKTLENSSTVTKEYTCKILCQGRNIGNENVGKDKTSVINAKIKEKFRKIVAEGEASDSNDSITSECRYFKPIDQKHIPLSMKIPVIKVPAIVITASTVIIGPPKGGTNLKRTILGSAFVPYNILTYPVCSEKIERLSRAEVVKSQKIDKNKAIETSPIPLRYQTRNKTNQKTPEKRRNVSPPINYMMTPSKRKRLRCSPSLASPKKCKTEEVTKSPPFYGFSNKNLNELKEKTNNGLFAGQSIINNSKYDHEVKKLQEEQDLKYAQKLHEELNSRGRYSTRNSISLQNDSTGKKGSGRQITLKEMIGQTANKVP